MVKKTIGQREARQILEVLRHEFSEKDKAYEAVRRGKVDGVIGEMGDVTVFSGGLSYVKYSRDGGKITYGF